ncbi:hotdog fold thioesterase [Pacificimonas aurantium]|nr:hotdog fold thioesterase [Pacificimonas aurantium]
MDKRVTMNEKMLQEALLISPFHRWLGLGIQSRTESELELTMPWREEIISNPSIGAAHGGILASLVDLTGLYVLIATGTSAKATADLRVDYHRPAIGGPLTAVGRAVKVGRQISVAESRILGSEGELLASGRGAYICG